MQTGKIVKIGVIVALVLAAAFVLWYLLRKSYAANKYGSAEAVKAGSTGQYGAFDTSAASYKYDAVWNLGIPGQFGSDANGPIYNADAFGQAWFKGMNIQLNNENVDRFKGEVKKYADNAAIRKPHWEVTVGSFLKSTTPAA